MISKSDDPTSIWHYFVKEDAKPSIQRKCKKCDTVMQSGSGSTSSMWKHLKQHSEIKVPEKETTIVSPSQKVHYY